MVSTKRFSVVALFTLVRAYNVAILVIALYATAFFLFFTGDTFFSFVVQKPVHFLVLASAFSVSAAYIINNFYDLERDQIGRPMRTYMTKKIPQSTKLTVYLLLNVTALVFAFLASWRVFVFFFVYQFFLWLYSHKLSRIVLVNNLSSTVLALFPFLALLLYFKHYSTVIFLHAVFLGLLLLIMDVVRDLYTYQADAVYDYHTLPTDYGVKITKFILSGLYLLSAMYAFYLAQQAVLADMHAYFYFMLLFFIFCFFWQWKFSEKKSYWFYYLSCKFAIGLGVVSLFFHSV